MEDHYAIAVLMFCFAGMLLLYAALLALIRDPKMIPRHYAANMKNKKAYCVQLAKVIALVSLAPLELGLISLLGHPGIGALVGLGQFIFSLWGGTKLMRSVTNE